MLNFYRSFFTLIVDRTVNQEHEQVTGTGVDVDEKVMTEQLDFIVYLTTTVVTSHSSRLQLLRLALY